jgi:hypothetical protein
MDLSSVLPITFSAMLCNVRFRMLCEQAGRIWKGIYDLSFEHHISAKELRHPKDLNCGICRALFGKLHSKFTPDTAFDELLVSVMASLYFPNPRVEHLYRLDMKLRCDHIRWQRTFVLKETSKIPSCLSEIVDLTMYQDTTVPPLFRTPIS